MEEAKPVEVLAVWVSCSEALRAANPGICHEGIRRDSYELCPDLARHYHKTPEHDHLLCAHGGLQLKMIKEHVG